MLIFRKKATMEISDEGLAAPRSLKEIPMERRLCMECGRPIPAGRLEALPDTVLCVRCVVVKPISGASVMDGADNSDLLDSVHGADMDR
jgi:hypothetical protein